MNNRSKYEIIKEKMKRMASLIMRNLTKKENDKSKSELEKITIEGPLTIENSSEVEKRVQESLKRGELTIDLTKVTKYDIACAGILLEAVREARANNHRLLIIYNDQIDRATRELFYIQNILEPYVIKKNVQQPITPKVYSQ